MNDAESSERAQLRLERARLDQQRAQLETDVARLAHSKDLPSVRALGVRLARYHGELATFVAALEAFHAQYGPLGE